MRVGDICTRDVVIIESNEPVMTAVKLMRDHHVGDVVLVDIQKDGRRIPAGILTDRDILIEVIAQEVAMDKVMVGDIMTYELLTANEDDNIGDVIKLMRSRGFRRLPVVDAGGALVGILSFDDLVDLLSEQLSDLVALIRNELRRERDHRG
jgi:CBS domain-containing protein